MGKVDVIKKTKRHRKSYFLISDSLMKYALKEAKKYRLRHAYLVPAYVDKRDNALSPKGWKSMGGGIFYYHDNVEDIPSGWTLVLTNSKYYDKRKYAVKIF